MNALKAKMLNSALEPPGPLGPMKGEIKEVTILPPVEPAKQPIKVILALPSGRTWEARTSTCVSGLMAYSALQGVSLGIINLEGSMITKQRNDLKDGATKYGADYIFFIDTDLVLPCDSLMRLLAHKKDVVGATYNKRVPPYETLGRLKGLKPTDLEVAKGGLREAELLPGGCMLVKMSVFDKITWPYYYESYQWPGKSGLEAFANMMKDNYSTVFTDDLLDEIKDTPFAQWLENTWKLESVNKWDYFSEDLNFCRKLIKAGITIWCDLTLTFELKHLGTLEVTCSAPKPQSVLVAAQM